MDINGWLTVISVFIAILAFFPQEERKLLLLKLYPFEYWIIFFGLIILIPYLIYFPSLSYRWAYLQKWTVDWGVKPQNFAFGIFYFIFLWIIIRMVWVVPRRKKNDGLIAYYKELLNELSFDRFFKLFRKYTPTNQVIKNWNQFYELVIDPLFLKNIISSKPEYLLQLWEQFNSEDDFKKVFRLFLENKDSLYYEEIKEHWNSYSILADKPFLNKVLVERLPQSIHAGLLPLFSDYVSNELHNQRDISLYNAPHRFLHNREEEGYDLPVFYHIQFINLLYSTAIIRNVDVSSLSHRYGNMQSIYSSMIAAMVQNLSGQYQNPNAEYPTNYHWLIAEIFSVLNHWLRSFNEDEHFDEHSSYVDFIAFNAHLCLSELCKGFETGKIDEQTIRSRCYYGILNEYFSPLLKDPLRSSIEEEIIANIPDNLLEPIFDFALDEAYATDFDGLRSGQFHVLNNREREIMTRLRNFLISKDKL